MMKLILYFVFTLEICLQISDASMCKPLSMFKVDCNICRCRESGLEFTCTQKICPPQSYKEKFTEEQNEDGYIILKPKAPQDKYIFDDSDDDFVLTRKSRQPRVIPYINDEIPPSREENGIGNALSFNKKIDNKNEEESSEEDYVVADLEEARQANLEDVNLDEDVDNWDHIMPLRRRVIKK